jgi:hypothetical protein
MQNLTMRGKALARMAPFSAPVSPPVRRMNARTPARKNACCSAGRLRISLSFLTTTQPRLPTTSSHSTSGASCLKWSSWTSTDAPAALSARATAAKVSVEEECEGRLTRRRGVARSGPLLRSRRGVDRSRLPDPESTPLPCSAPQCLRWRYQSQPTRAGRRRSADRS